MREINESLSVIIPTYDHQGRMADLLDLLRSLSSDSNLKHISEVIIVDNGGTVEDLSYVTSLPIGCKVRIVEEPRIGLNLARNTGIACARSEILAFLDDDVVVASCWARGITEGYRNGALCVGGPVLVKDQDLKFPRWFSDYFFRFLLPPSFPEAAGRLEKPYYLIGANMSFKNEAFDRFGLYDPELDRQGRRLLSAGDIEFIMRLPNDRVWYAPEAVALEKIHEGRLTRRFLIRRIFWQGVSDSIVARKRGLANFYDKDEILVTPALFAGLAKSVAAGNLFEALCIVVRQCGYRYRNMFSK